MTTKLLSFIICMLILTGTTTSHQHQQQEKRYTVSLTLKQWEANIAGLSQSNFSANLVNPISEEIANQVRAQMAAEQKPKTDSSKIKNKKTAP